MKCRSDLSVYRNESGDEPNKVAKVGKVYAKFKSKSFVLVVVLV